MIALDGVSKTIRGAVVLSGVSISVESGEVVGLEGPNGSGKTMLMRCVAGLVRPTKGTVAVDGKTLFRDVSFPPSLGMLIENPAFLDNRTGAANLSILALIKNLVGEERIKSVLVEVGLDPEDKRSFRKYSLGMKQRLGIAAAVMEDPDVLLFDEPTNALDASGVEMLKTVLRKQAKRGASVLLSCHDGTLLRELSDEVCVLREGEVAGYERLR